MFTDFQQVKSTQPGAQFRELLPGVKDVLTLGFIALLSGFFIALALFTLLAIFNHPQALKASLVAWTCSQAVLWLCLLSRWNRLLFTLERSLHLDINGDGFVGEPEQAEQEPQAPAVRVEISENDGQQVSRIDLPATQAQIKALAIGLMSGSSFSESAWTGHQAPFSKSEFIRLRDEMLKRRLIQWRNDRAPAQGLELSKSGKAVMRYFASEVQS